MSGTPDVVANVAAKAALDADGAAQIASSTLEISNWAPTNEIDSRSKPQAFFTDDLVMAFPYACACACGLKSKSNLAGLT
jgi:hypothetical protein